MEKMQNNTTVIKYTIFGIAFGIVFPLLAVLLRYLEGNWDLVIICTAPGILGIVFAIVGKKQQTVENTVAHLKETNRRLEETQRNVEEALESVRKLMELFGEMLQTLGKGRFRRVEWNQGIGWRNVWHSEP